MVKDIDPKLKTVGEYLKVERNEKFVVPEYQREYSWTITQCDELFNDIKDFTQENRKDRYFFGTIIIECQEEKHDDETKLNLIDGQQRTTTFLLLLKALLLRMEGKLNDLRKDAENKDLIERLEDRKKDIIDILYKTDIDTRAELLKDWSKVSEISLLENTSINEMHGKELQVILSAKTYDDAENKCYKIPRKQKDNKYTAFFKNFKFFYDNLKLDAVVLNTFARIFLEECQVIEIRSWRQDQAIAMFNSLNSTGLPLADADIIFSRMFSYAGKEKDDLKINWDNVKTIAERLDSQKIVNIDSILQEYMYIKRAKDKEYKINYVTTPGVRNYYTILHKDILKNPKDLSGSFLKIANLWDKIYQVPVIKLLLKFNENIKLYLSSYLYRYEVEKISEEIVLEISECLIRLFTILELVEAGYSSSDFKTFLFNENLKLVDEEYSCAQIKVDFDKHISEKWGKEDLKKRLLKYDKNVLVFLNEYLYAKEKKLKFDFDEKVNIEHVMPSSGRNLETIRNDAGIETKDEFEDIVNLLGNKILLEEDINKSIGRDWFITKKQKTIEEKAGYKKSKYNIARSLIDYKSDFWTKKDIEEANDKAVNRIIKFIFNE